MAAACTGVGNRRDERPIAGFGNGVESALVDRVAGPTVDVLDDGAVLLGRPQLLAVLATPIVVGQGVLNSVGRRRIVGGVLPGDAPPDVRAHVVVVLPSGRGGNTAAVDPAFE